MTFLTKFSFLLKPLYRYYSSKGRILKFRGLQIYVESGIFNPLFFYSTKDLINYIEEIQQEPSSLLELGCGSAMLSVYFAKKGWIITSSDLNPRAISNAVINAEKNGVEIKTIRSDLFEEIADISFNFIAINPPYFQRDAKNLDESAWFCGSNFEYFKKLFSQLQNRNKGNERIVMVLSDKCKLDNIQKLASQYEIKMILKKSIHHMLEVGFIFELEN